MKIILLFIFIFSSLHSSKEFDLNGHMISCTTTLPSHSLLGENKLVSSSSYICISSFCSSDKMIISNNDISCSPNSSCGYIRCLNSDTHEFIDTNGDGYGDTSFSKCQENEERGDDGECQAKYNQDPNENNSNLGCEEYGNRAVSTCGQVGLILDSDSFQCMEVDGKATSSPSYDCVKPDSNGGPTNDDIFTPDVPNTGTDTSNEIEDNKGSNEDDTTDLSDIFNNQNTANKNISNKMNEQNRKLSNINENISRQGYSTRKQINQMDKNLQGGLSKINSDNSVGLDRINTSINNGTNTLNDQLQKINDFNSKKSNLDAFTTDGLEFDQSAFEKEITDATNVIAAPFKNRIVTMLKNEKNKYFSKEYFGQSCNEIETITVTIMGSEVTLMSQQLIDRFGIMNTIRQIVLMIFAISGVLFALRGD